MKRVFVVHGWGGSPDEGIFPWLRRELEREGYAVFCPAMPNPLEPRIEEWVPFLAEQVGVPDEGTYLFGHSIGAQTIIRYLASLPEGSGVARAVFLAGWLNLTDEAYDDEDDREIGRPWREVPIDWERARKNARQFVAIFSDDDPLVPLSDADTFRDKLGAEIVIEHGKEHFSGSTGIRELPSAFDALTE